MLAFRVKLNQRPPTTAGISGTHVLSAIVTSIVRTKRHRRESSVTLPVRELCFTLSGASTHDDGSGEYFDWDNVRLRVGDKLVIDIIQTNQVDPPTLRRPFSKGAAPKTRAKATRKKRTR